MRHGFLLIDKPRGITSHDAVGIVRKRLGERGVGHLGTLDPAATGLLVLAVGRKALKVVTLFGDLRKEYEAEVRLGAVSSTYDAEGVVEPWTPKPGWEIPHQIVIQNLIADRFVGKIRQVPPAHSAVHIGGERAYEKARRGETVVMPERTVDIEQCEILSYDYPELRLRIRCGSGTYIRSLAHDMGQLLHCGGYLTALRRTEVGEWTVDGAVSPDSADWHHVVPMKTVLTNFPRRDLTDDEWEDISHGRNIEAEVQPNTIAWHGDLPVALLVQAEDGTVRAKRVF